MGSISLSILTPEKVIFEGSADEIYMVMHDGQRGFLKDHAPLMGTVGIGMLRLKVSDKISCFEVEGGIVEINGNRMIVLAEEAMRKEELSEKVISGEIARLEALLPAAVGKDQKKISLELKKLSSRMATAQYKY